MSDRGTAERCQFGGSGTKLGPTEQWIKDAFLKARVICSYSSSLNRRRRRGSLVLLLPNYPETRDQSGLSQVSGNHCITTEKAEVHERAPPNEAEEGDKNGARGFKTEEEQRLSGRDKREERDPRPARRRA